MVGVSKLDIIRVFDGEGYIERYPDLKQAVEGGLKLDPWLHFERHGMAEGREFVDFDAAYYVATYPVVMADIEAGQADSPLQHYIKIGRGCGYLPNPRAGRPLNPGAAPSRFGGLWIDNLDAPARILGRLESGQISARQARQLQQFVRDGFLVINNAIEPERLEHAMTVFDRAFSGGYPQLMFDCPPISPGKHRDWCPEINEYPSKALDIHHFGRAMRDLIFAPAITEFLGLIFEAKAFASQTLGFLRGSAQEGHQDSAHVPYTQARSFAASWIALEDVTIGAGELFYYVGSHRMPDFLYDQKYKSVAEGQRLTGKREYRDQTRVHVQQLEERAAEYGLRKEVFAARKGDVLIWHADLVHGGNPVSREITRKSVVTHYCPKYLLPLFAERQDVKVHQHQGHLFTSGHYRTFDPLD